jgi:hypothetical protein
MLRDDPRPLGTSPLSRIERGGSGGPGGYPVNLAARLAPLAVFVTSMVLYLQTLMPGKAFDDWGEMQTVPHVLGIAHPTGYPTYILTAWLFELLPFGSIAFRANLYAAVCVAVAMAALTAIGIRLGVRPTIAAATALATGAIGTIWASAVVAEVNALHLALLALIIERTLAWSDSRRPRDLAIGGLLVGLALGNHLLTAFTAPFLVLFALWDGREALRDRPKLLLWPIAAGLAGLCVYLYIPLAASVNPPLAYNHPTTVDGFLFLVTGRQFAGQYQGLFSVDSIGRLVGAIDPFWRLVGQRAFWLIPVAGLFGLGVIVVRRWAVGLALLLVLFISLDIWATYNNATLEHYLLVPWMLLGLGTAVALEAAARMVRRWAPPAAKGLGGPVAALGAAAMAVLLITTNLPVVDRSEDRTGDAFVDQVFNSLPQNAVILSWWGSSPPLWHAQFVEGRRPDITIVDDSNVVYEGWGTRENRIAAVICTRPVYLLLILDGDVNQARARYDLTLDQTVTIGAGAPTGRWPRPLYRVSPKPGTCS